MDQRHEHLLFHPDQFPHRFLHLGVSPLVAHLPDALVDPLGANRFGRSWLPEVFPLDYEAGAEDSIKVIFSSWREEEFEFGYK